MGIGKGEDRTNRPIHVEPHPMVMAEGGNGGQGIHRSSHGGAGGGHYGDHGNATALQVGQILAEAGGIQAARGVHGD